MRLPNLKRSAGHAESQIITHRRTVQTKTYSFVFIHMHGQIAAQELLHVNCFPANSPRNVASLRITDEAFEAMQGTELIRFIFSNLRIQINATLTP